MGATVFDGGIWVPQGDRDPFRMGAQLMAEDEARDTEPTVETGADGSQVVDARLRTEGEPGDVDPQSDAARRTERARKLGEAAVAAGWRSQAAERIAPRVAGAAPVSGGDIRAVLGLLFLAMSGSYLVKTLFTAVRHDDAAQQRSSRHGAGKGTRSMALPLAGASKGWRKAVADRVTPRLAARTPLEEHQARAVLGASFLALSTYYVTGSLRRFVRMGSGGA